MIDCEEIGNYEIDYKWVKNEKNKTQELWIDDNLVMEIHYDVFSNQKDVKGHMEHIDMGFGM